MANKKLKVELELETAKAKQQMGQLGGTTSPGPSPSSQPSDRLAKATEMNTSQMIAMTRAFTGMAIGLAATYSAGYLPKGSTAERALSYSGGIISGAAGGAAMGMPAGPTGAAVGAVVGGVAGGAKTYLDEKKAREKMAEDYKRSEDIYLGNEKFANDMKRITSSFNEEDLAMKLARLSGIYTNLKEYIATLDEGIKDAIDRGDAEDLANLKAERDVVRGRKKTVFDIAEKLDSSYLGESVGSFSATNALQKIGGGFGATGNGGSSGSIEILMNGVSVQNELLREIRDITGKKGGSWL